MIPRLSERVTVMVAMLRASEIHIGHLFLIGSFVLPGYRGYTPAGSLTERFLSEASKTAFSISGESSRDSVAR